MSGSVTSSSIADGRASSKRSIASCPVAASTTS
jgi:hypothetical protein